MIRLQCLLNVSFNSLSLLPTYYSLPFGIQAVPKNEPSPEALVSISQILKKYSSNQEVEPPTSLCGRVINIVIWETNHWSLIEKAKDYFTAGKFIRLRNVRKVSFVLFILKQCVIVCLVNNLATSK